MTIAVILCFSFSCGIILERCLCVDGRILSFFSIVSIIFCFLFLKMRRLFYVFFIFAVFLAGAMAYLHELSLPSDSIVFVRPCQRKDAIIHAIALSDSVVSGKKAVFPAEVFYLYSPCRSGAACGKIMVEDFFRRPYRFGDELILKGRLRLKPSRGRFLNKGIYLFLDVDADGLLIQPMRGRGNVFKAAAFWMKRQAMELISRHMDFEGASILYAMLLGERNRLPREMKNAMIRTGIWHIMVVSGFHVTLMIAMVLLFLKVVLLPRRWRVCLAIGILWIYCLLNGFAVSVLRAVIMSSIFLAGSLLERKSHFYNTFFLTAFFILIFDPLQLFDVGFQLSFLSVFFIVWLSPRIKNVFPPRISKTRMGFWIIEYFCVAVSAWLGTIPVLSYHFGGLSVLAVAANMVLVPLGSLIVLSGFTLVFFAAVLKPAASLVAHANLCLMAIFLKISHFFSTRPFAYISSAKMPLSVVVVSYGLLFLCAMMLDRKKKAGIEDNNRL